MNILAVTACYYPELQFGGPPLKIHTLNVGLHRAGYTVEVVTFHSQRPQGGGPHTIDGITVHYLPWIGRGRISLPTGVGPLTAAVRRAQVIHIYGLYNLIGPYAAWQARRAHLPYVVEPMGMYTPRARSLLLKRAYHALFTHPMTRHAARVIATSATEQAELKPIGAADRLVVRGHLFDFAAYDHLPDRANFRRLHHLADDTPLILFVGRISPIKNLDTLIHAFVQSAPETAHLFLVGPQSEPDYVHHLQQVIHSLKVEQRVHLTGALYDTQKLAALAAADLFVLPSLSESFGNAAAEAIAANLPVLLTDTCGIAPMIDGRAGLAVSPTVEGLALGLRRLLDPDQRTALTKARAIVHTELTTDAPLRQLEQIYQQVAQESAVPHSHIPAM